MFVCFQTGEAVFTLSAMTGGIRRNWIQAIMKNVHPSTAPDVARNLRPDVKSDFAPVPDSIQDKDGGQQKSRVRERRRDGRSKTFDWAEFRPIAQALAQQRALETEFLPVEVTHWDKTKQCEDRQKRYEIVAGAHPGEGSRMELDGALPTVTFERQQKMQDEIEQHWQQVEQTPIREERRVPLATVLPNSRVWRFYGGGGSLLFMEELRSLLERTQQELEESHRYRHEIEAQLNAALEREQNVLTGYISPLEPSLDLEAKLEAQRRQQEAANLQAQNLTKTYQEAREVIQQQSIQIQSFQTRLELFVSQAAFNDQTLANVQNQLFMERQRNKDQADELEGKVSMFNSQLRDNEERLKEAESQLLEKSQALRDLERQMALQRNHQREKLCESAKEQQEKKVLKEKLIKAEEKERECTMRLQAMEAMLDMAQKEKLATSLKSSEMVRQMEEHVELSEVTVKKLAQDIEILSTENERLNQRYQELANQLTEADREIERLKANLILKQEGQCNLLDDYEIAIEEGKRLKDELRKSEQNLLDKKDLYERELEKKNWELHEASSELEALRRSLGKTEKKLQLKEATLKGLGFQLPALDEIDQLKEEKLLLLAELEDTKVRLLQQESRLQVAEHSSVELQSLNNELKLKLQTAKQHYGQQIPKAEKKPQRLQEELSNLNKTFLLSARHELKEETTASREYQQVLKSKLSLESKALNKVANTLLNMDSNVVRTLQEFKRYTESTQSPPMFSADSDVLIEQSALRKILLEGQFWASVSNISDSRTSALEEHTIVGAYRTSRLDLVMEELRREISRDKGSAPVLPSWNKIADIETDNSVRTELAQDLQRQVRLLNQITTSIQSTSDNEVLSKIRLQHNNDITQMKNAQKWQETLETDQSGFVALLQSKYEADLKRQKEEFQEELDKLKVEMASLKHGENSAELTHIQIEGKPIDSLDKTIELQDMAAKHKKQLRELKEAYETKIEKLKCEIVKAGETLKLKTEENIKEIDSLTVCMENLQKKHEEEMKRKQEEFEMEKKGLPLRPVTELEEVMDSAKEMTTAQGPENSKSIVFLRDRIQELEAQISTMRLKMEQRELGHGPALKEKYEKDLENLKATCERGFAAMEESHQKVLEELQRQHQRELEKLEEEKERLLAEETAATIAGMNSGRCCRKTMLIKSTDFQNEVHYNSVPSKFYPPQHVDREELASLHREIEVLSEQYSQKCLENAHLAQALEAERQALRQCQRENQELNAHNHELNNCLAAEITRLRSVATGEGGGDICAVTQGKEVYELEVFLRVKESEVQYLKQEINSLKDELQTAQR
uniref:PH domain-containing protein n=1 Tax=Latimeria chalumnae TaxID=7897 RepID=H2ZTL5_LATCH